jgi:hypothetical protein
MPGRVLWPVSGKEGLKLAMSQRTTWSQCVKRFETTVFASLFPSNPSSSPSTTPPPPHLVRSYLFIPCPLLSLISCHHFIQKKRRNLFFLKVVKTWRVPVDVSIVAAVRGVSVLLLPSSCRRVCRRMYLLLPSSPLPPFLVHGAVLTGTATFFLNCYTSTGHNQTCYRKSMLCASFVSKKQSVTRLRTAQRRARPLGKNYPSYSDQMTRSRESLTRVRLPS